MKQFLKQDRKLLNAGHPQHEYGRKDDPIPDVYLAPAGWATPLCYALRGGDVPTVECLISRKAKINGFERSFFIAANGSPEMVRLLLENGADPTHAPQVHPGDELYEVVSKFGVHRPSKRSDSEELVYLCRGDRGGNTEEAARLISVGADVNFRDHKGKTALHRAARSGFIETMHLLLDHGAATDIPDANGDTALFDVVRSTIKKTDRKIEAVRVLLKAGANPRHENQKNQTPISVAEQGLREEMPEIARILKRKRRT